MESLQLDGIHLDLSWTEDHPKVIHLVLFEHAFLRFQEEIVFLEASEDLSDELSVFVHSCHCNQDVIHIDEYLTSADEVLEDFVHHCLERRRRVGEAKEHDKRFKHSSISFECCLPFVAWFDSYIIVSPTDIELGEDASVLEFINDIRNEGEGILTFDRKAIKLSVVLNWLKFTILFLHKEERRGEWGLGFPNVPMVQHVFKEHIKGLLFFDIERVDFAVVGGDRFGFEFNTMVPLSEWGKSSGGFLFKDSVIFEVLLWYELLQGFDFLLQVFLCSQFCGLSGMSQVFVWGGKCHEDLIAILQVVLLS